MSPMHCTLFMCVFLLNISLLSVTSIKQSDSRNFWCNMRARRYYVIFIANLCRPFEILRILFLSILDNTRRMWIAVTGMGNKPKKFLHTCSNRGNEICWLHPGNRPASLPHSLWRETNLISLFVWVVTSFRPMQLPRRFEFDNNSNKM